MTRLGLLRAQAVLLGRSPAVWLTLLFLSLAWLAWLEVGTYGVTTTRVRGDAPLYEIAFLAGLAGSALATANCERSSWLLHPQGPWGRFASQGLALAGAATALQVLALGVPVALGLVHTRRLNELITAMRERYDRILFDSPPVIGVSDASVLASAVDGALLLVQHGRNPAAMTLRAQQTLRSAHTPLVGTILNQVPADGGEDYGYYAHNYAYYSDNTKDSSSGPSGRRSRSSAAGGTKRNVTDESGPERLDFNEPGK